MLTRAVSSWVTVVACLLAVALLVAAPRASHAQIISPDLGVSLGARKNTALTVSVLSGGVQSIASITDGAINAFSSPVRVQTTWSVNPGLTGSVQLVAYFTDPTSALAAGPSARIASSRVQGRMATGLPAAFTAFTGVGIGGVGTAGASLRLFSVNITGPNRNATRTDDLDLRLDLTGQPPLSVGTYTGMIYLRAVTM